MRHYKHMQPFKPLRPHKRALIIIIVLLALASLACNASNFPGLAGTVTPPPLPTPLSDTISFSIPSYSTRLQVGESVPGTRLEYVGRGENTYNVRIDGQDAIKRAGDSFVWSGVVAPGVLGKFNLRLATAILGGLPVAGPIDLIIFNPEPAALEETIQPEGALHFHSILIDYTIPLNAPIPGTALTYEGIEGIGLGEQVTQLARLGGTAGYPNLAVGDSFVWYGRLRDNVILRLNLRVISYQADRLRLAGTAELWILPA